MGSPGTPNLVAVLFGGGDQEQAVSLAELAVQCWRAKLGDEDRQTLEVSTQLAYYYWIAGRFDEAARINRDVLDICRRVDGENSEGTLTARGAVGLDLRTRGDFATSARESEDTYRRARKLFGPDDPTTLWFARVHCI